MALRTFDGLVANSVFLRVSSGDGRGWLDSEKRGELNVRGLNRGFEDSRFTIRPGWDWQAAVVSLVRL